jgi:hypothetical protein
MKSEHFSVWMRTPVICQVILRKPKTSYGEVIYL